MNLSGIVNGCYSRSGTSCIYFLVVDIFQEKIKVAVILISILRRFNVCEIFIGHSISASISWRVWISVGAKSTRILCIHIVNRKAKRSQFSSYIKVLYLRYLLRLNIYITDRNIHIYTYIHTYICIFERAISPYIVHAWSFQVCCTVYFSSTFVLNCEKSFQFLINLVYIYIVYKNFVYNKIACFSVKLIVKLLKSN